MGPRYELDERLAPLQQGTGVLTRVIQKLAGHQDLATTQRYMHLSPPAIDASIRLMKTGTTAVEKKGKK